MRAGPPTPELIQIVLFRLEELIGNLKSSFFNCAMNNEAYGERKTWKGFWIN